MLHALQRLRYVAQSTADKFASHAPPSKPVAYSPFTRDLPLQIPPPLTSQIVSLGVDEIVANRISSAFERATHRLKATCEAGYRSRCQSLLFRAHYFDDSKHSSLIPSTYVALYSKTVQGWMDHLLTNIIPRITRVRANRERVEKKPFNQVAVPTLERFFNHNAFPSRLEKWELASQCDMSYKQIETWFQNRRSRSKKEGKHLRRPSRGETLYRALEDSVVEPFVNTGKEVVREEGEMEASHPITSGSPPLRHTFDLDAPPHAFPSLYPPICAYDPFPKDRDPHAFPTPWPRFAQTSEPVRHSSIDMEDLLVAFASLTLSECDPSHSASFRCRSQPWCIGFATYCPRAPHPALLNPGSRVPCDTVWPTRSNSPRATRRPAGVSRTRVSCSTSRVVRGLHPLAPLSPEDGSQKRTLPRRLPKNLPIHHQQTRAQCTTTAPSSPSRHIVSDNSRKLSGRSLSSQSSLSDTDRESPLSTPQTILQALPILSPLSVPSPWGLEFHPLVRHSSSNEGPSADPILWSALFGGEIQIAADEHDTAECINSFLPFVKVH